MCAMEFKKYEESGNISFCFGGFPTYELLKNKPQHSKKVFVSSKLQKNDEWQKIEMLCKEHNILIEQNDKQIERLGAKGNTFVVGVFEKYRAKVEKNQNAVVLDKPSDMGNLGTIMREMLGFGYKNLIVTKPCADFFNPKVVRASMGAIFGLDVETFESFDDFEKQNTLPLYLFMLGGTTNLSQIKGIKSPHALVFGNEATGLPKDYAKKGVTIKIHHSTDIDSLNLGMSVGIGLYEFSKKNFE